MTRWTVFGEPLRLRHPVQPRLAPLLAPGQLREPEASVPSTV